MCVFNLKIYPEGNDTNKLQTWHNLNYYKSLRSMKSGKTDIYQNALQE